MSFRTPIRVFGLTLVGLGVNLKKIIYSLKGAGHYLKSLLWLVKMSPRYRDKQFKLRICPVLSDAYDQSGIAKGHYFHQDLWASRRIFAAKPQNHIDVGSRIDGFVAHVLTFMDVSIIDVRSLKSNIVGLSFIQKNMMLEAEIGIQKYDSVSCLHALEHFGLGRYRDPLDWDGWQKGLKNISNLVKIGGKLYISVPVGLQAIEFNAHRIFSPKTIVDECQIQGLQLIDFSYIDDNGDFHPSVALERAVNCDYGCGCFEFIKKFNI
jgi:hypothetical protein